MKCPLCNSKAVAEIVYGLVSMKLIEKKLARKEIVLGGCVISDDDVKFECTNCFYRWR